MNIFYFVFICDKIVKGICLFIVIDFREFFCYFEWFVVII